MKFTRGLLSAFFLLLFSLAASAQDTLRLSRAQCEAIFLRENLLLLAEQLNIAQADAEVLQARLWPNPTFSIEEVNLWMTLKQKESSETLPPVAGNWNPGKYQQASLSIEQLIQTAGKRRKLIALHQVSADRARQYFEEVLRGLKLELRHQLTSLQYLQESRTIYVAQLASLRQLVTAYEGQVAKGYASRADYMRLKAQELELSRHINEHEQDINEAQKELNLLLRLPATTQLVISAEGFLKNTSPVNNLSLPQLMAAAKESRPDYQLAILDKDFSQRALSYEKAQAVPDLNLKAAYDRGSSLYPNFIGFGVGVDLPFFNRNQGNIRAARAGVQEAQLRLQHQELSVDNETALAYKNLLRAISFYGEIEQDYEQSLDDMLDSYTRNFRTRNISMLEYLDFLEAFLTNKTIILEARKEVTDRAEELNYTVGRDVLP